MLGFCNFIEGEITIPPLSTMNINFKELGSECISLLSEMIIKGKAVIQEKIYVPQLLDRNSIALIHEQRRRK